MFAVTLWELFTLAREQPWAGYSVSQILQSIEERNERLPCPARCPSSIYNLLLSCWAVESKARPPFRQITAHLNSSRPRQYRVSRDHKQFNHLTLLRGDTISVFDCSPEKALCKGQNHRTEEVGVFPRLCLSTSTNNEKISWPVQGSFIHTAHRDPTNTGTSWGNIDSIDETILNNPIVNSLDRNDNVQIVSNLLEMNVSSVPPLITRAPPPIPRPDPLPRINEDLCLIDFSDPLPPPPSVDCRWKELLPFDPIPVQPSNSSTDPKQFVAQVVSGVTEQLKSDFPRLNSTTKDFTPPLIRRFTIPYPSSSSSSSSRPS